MGVMIGSKIKNMRLSKCISQNALAKKAGIAQSTLSYIESNKKHPQFHTLSLICQALDTSVLDLLSFEEERTMKKMFEERKKFLYALAEESGMIASAQYEFDEYLYERYKQAIKAITTT